MRQSQPTNLSQEAKTIAFTPILALYKQHLTEPTTERRLTAQAQLLNDENPYKQLHGKSPAKRLIQITAFGAIFYASLIAGLGLLSSLSLKYLKTYAVSALIIGVATGLAASFKQINIDGKHPRRRRKKIIDGKEEIETISSDPLRYEFKKKPAKA